VRESEIAGALIDECNESLVERGRRHMPPTTFDEGLVALIDKCAGDLGFTHAKIVSGAGHDSLHTAQFAPTAMIFVPCTDGLSHNEAEAASAADLAAGADVLMQAVVAVANEGI
jgi:N-carbamoyl-L-amino-acid hydrolase